MKFSLENNKIPILTTKKMAWKTCLKELLFFIKGDTNNDNLKNNNVHIWNANCSREFLDKRKLFNRPVDDLGPIYGFQWRHFNARYENCNSSYKDKGIDQLNNIIKQLKDPKQRFSRRLIMTAWNPLQLDEMALPPCHLLCQFNVIDTNKLTCCLYQRSGDIGLGIPFNIASYAFLTHLIAHICNLKAYQFNHYISNAHIYEDHASKLLEQTQMEPYEFPTLTILNNYDNIDNYQFSDFIINDYKHHPTIKLNMHA